MEESINILISLKKPILMKGTEEECGISGLRYNGNLEKGA